MKINREKITLYLNMNITDGVYKILPLYEESNQGLEKYLSSLLIELYGLDEVFRLEEVEYVSLLATLEGLKFEILKDKNKSVVKREVFKCVRIVKKLSKKTEGLE